jgi:hypothetical protein
MSSRERVEAAARALKFRLAYAALPSWFEERHWSELAEAALAAADEAEPMVSKQAAEKYHVEHMAAVIEALASESGRADRAERAARELAGALRDIALRSDHTDPTTEALIAETALTAHPELGPSERHRGD